MYVQIKYSLLNTKSKAISSSRLGSSLKVVYIPYTDA